MWFTNGFLEPVHLCLKLTCLSLGMCVAANVFAESTDGTEMYRAGLALVKAGKLEQGIAVFEKARESDGENPLLLDAAGAAYSLRGDLERAKEYFVRCLSQDPAFVPARKNLAITYFSMGRYDLATVEFQKVKERSAESGPAADLFLGMMAEKSAKYPEAVKLLEDSRALLDRFPEAILSLVRAEMQLTHFERAREALGRLDGAQGITARQYFEAAELHSRLGQNEKALAGWNQAVRIARETGDLGLAMESLRRAVRLDPAREDNYLDFSSICAEYENYPLALEAADTGLAHIPGSYRLSIQKGVILEKLGRYGEAEDVLRAAAAVEKNNSVALLSLAIIETHAGRLKDAETTLQSALKTFPDNYYMHYQMGKILVQLEESDQNADLRVSAKKAFRQAIHCNPSFADSYYQLAKLYLRESPQMAEQSLSKCLQLDPNHASAEYTLARLYLSEGKQAAGQELMNRFERQRQTDKLREKQKPRIELARQ